MVNRIDEKNYYNYTKAKNVNIPDNGEKFSLNYSKEELLTGNKEKKDKADEPEKGLKQSDGQNGVRLELSGRGRAASADSGRAAGAEAAKTKDADSQQPVMGMIRGIVAAVVSAVKDFFYKIWNEPETKAEAVEKDRPVASPEASAETAASTDASDSGKITEAAAVTESAAMRAEKQEWQTEAPGSGMQNAAENQKIAEARLDREIRPYLRKGDINQVINLLTDNGKKTVAMNSTLLSYYDRNGKMVEINASDRERILRGDRNARKL